jgi:hypothetical protein
LEVNGSKRWWRPTDTLGSVNQRDFGSYEDFYRLLKEKLETICFLLGSLTFKAVLKVTSSQIKTIH